MLSSIYIHNVCDKCTFCKMYVKDIECLFAFCPFFYFKADIIKKVNLEPHDILLCFQNPSFSDKQMYIINLVIILAKFYIHKSKVIQKKPSYITFCNTDIKIHFETLSNMRSPNKKIMKTIPILKLFTFMNFPIVCMHNVSLIVLFLFYPPFYIIV